MRKIAFFTTNEVAEGKVNEFLAVHPAVSGGISQNMSGVYVSYEDGSITDGEMIAHLQSEVNKLKINLLTMQPDIRAFLKKKVMLSQEAETSDTPELKQKVELAENQLIAAMAESDRISLQLEAHEALIKDIQEGNYKI